MGSCASLPVLCHVESTMSTAHVVCCVRDGIGGLDNDHDDARVLILFQTDIWLFVELELKPNEPTLKHMTS